MIPPFLFWGLSAGALVLSVYSFLDNQNRIFGHIFTGVTATILWFLLGVNVMGGNVGDVVPVATNQTTNNTSLSYSYTTITIPMMDTGLGWVFVFLGVVMLIVTLLAVIEIVGEMAGGEILDYDTDDE